MLCCLKDTAMLNRGEEARPEKKGSSNVQSLQVLKNLQVEALVIRRTLVTLRRIPQRDQKQASR